MQQDVVYTSNCDRFVFEQSVVGSAWNSFYGFKPRWRYDLMQFVCLCWGLMSQSTIFQSCRDGATASWVINQYFRRVKCLAQGHNTAAVGFEPPDLSLRSPTLYHWATAPRFNAVTQVLCYNVPWTFTLKDILWKSRQILIVLKMSCSARPIDYTPLGGREEKQYYRKLSKYSDTRKKLLNPRSSLSWVCTVCPGLSVRKLRNILIHQQPHQKGWIFCIWRTMEHELTCKVL